MEPTPAIIGISVDANDIIELIANEILPRPIRSGANTATNAAIPAISACVLGDKFENQLAICPTRFTTFSIAGARYAASCVPSC